MKKLSASLWRSLWKRNEARWVPFGAGFAGNDISLIPLNIKNHTISVCLSLCASDKVLTICFKRRWLGCPRGRSGLMGSDNWYTQPFVSVGSASMDSTKNIKKKFRKFPKAKLEFSVCQLLFPWHSNSIRYYKSSRDHLKYIGGCA